MTFLKTSGTPFHGTPMSAIPLAPNPSDGLPVAASSATSRAPPGLPFGALAVNITRSGLLRSPGQYASPRPVESPSGIANRQISFPVAASSAISELLRPLP